ncbi:nucleotide-binding protein [Paenibacillus sp. 481]|uniref:nucleotide-binding protein n=1 Tax=Paenibacillus sp. 481 TaxID=2835869 RepID=UPI001E2DCCB2|nr:ParA family protein [Paenibacillus sp. 481]UHA72044.1 ParA family protein [Paenibacillus sp. 481]
MNKRDVVLALHDKRMLDSMTAYWKQSKYVDQLQLRVFSQVDTLQHYLRLQPGIALLVTQGDVLDALEEEDVQDLSIMLLGERTDIVSMKHRNHPQCSTELLYQPLPHLLQKMLERVGAPSEAERAGDGAGGASESAARTGCSIIAVASACGGSGKTTAACQLARYAAEKGLRTFLLSVEEHAGFHVLLPQMGRANDHAPNHFSQLLYYLKRDLKTSAKQGEGYKIKFDLQAEGDKQQALAPESFVVSLPLLRADTFVSPASRAEWNMVDADLTRGLIRWLAESNRYDVIIIDSGAGHVRAEAAWEMAHHIVWLLNDDLAHLHNTLQLFNHWEQEHSDHYRQRMTRLKLIVNRYMGTMMNRWQHGDAAICGFLPYIPHWKQVHRPEQWFSSAVYQTALADWADTQLMLGGMRAGEGRSTAT